MAVTLSTASRALLSSKIHPSWNTILQQALSSMDHDYLNTLAADPQWLPGHTQIFNAFSQPRDAVRYVLIGESPYPRSTSANGYAFWDANVSGLWSETGLSKTVNRATSLRNMLKMLLTARHALTQDTSQAAIASIDKSGLVSTLTDLFNNFLGEGFLLLNACPVLSERPVRQEARFWQTFNAQILTSLDSNITYCLFGKIAELIEPLLPTTAHTLIAEHPYNISFIQNSKVLDCFRPLDLLRKRNPCQM